MVPLAGIEPALLAELDFESSASTNSATGAFRSLAERGRTRSGRNIAGAPCRSTRASLFDLNPSYQCPNAFAWAARMPAGADATGAQDERLPPRHRFSKTLQCDRAS